MSKPDLIHPVLGPLLWEEDSQWWVGSHRLRVGTEIDLFIEPGDTDRHAILTRAAE